MKRATLCLLAASLLFAGCPGPTPPTDVPTDGASDVAVDAEQDVIDDVPVDTAPRIIHEPQDCDPLDERECAMPWPSNLYLQPDPSRATGFALNFGRTSLPDNRSGRVVDPTPYRRMDGYSVGTPLIVFFPTLDVSNMATEDHIERSLLPDAPVLWFEVDGTNVRRIPYWVEHDLHEMDPMQRVLFVRPAVILREGMRYVVAFRNLRDRSGGMIAPSPAFAALRDRTAMNDPRLSPRIPRFEQVFSTLEAQGVMRNTLTLAWDFNTASNQALHGTMLAMRDDALTAVGPMGPALTVTERTEYARTMDGSGREVNSDIMLELRGTFEVPHYMVPLVRGLRGWQLNYDASGRVMRSDTRTAQFWVRIPWSAMDGTPHSLIEYGHGLLGAGTQVRSGFNGRIANTHRFIFYAASLAGMSDEDVGLLPTMLSDLTYFPWIADRLHQGVLEYVLLARAMRNRLQQLPDLMTRNIRVNSDESYYSGISQGGIFGGTVVALSPDLPRGHCGVPGNNYSTLLHRSVDFTDFFNILQRQYLRTSNQAVALSTIQILWDRTDPVSYYRHLSADPFPGTGGPHHIILAPALGDWQVAVVTNEIAARSDIGIGLMANYDAQRMPALITPTPFPHMGSGVVLYNFGNPWPPIGNLPPNDMVGDPHESPRRNDEHNRQMVEFFRTGRIIDVCGGDGCTPN